MILAKKNWSIYVTDKIEEKERKNRYIFQVKWKDHILIDYDEWKFLPLVKKFLEDFHMRIFSLKEKIVIWWIWALLLVLIIFWFFFRSVINQNKVLVWEIETLRTKTQNINNIDIQKMNTVNDALLEKLWIDYKKTETEKNKLSEEEAKKVIESIKK